MTKASILAESPGQAVETGYASSPVERTALAEVADPSASPFRPGGVTPEIPVTRKARRRGSWWRLAPGTAWAKAAAIGQRAAWGLPFPGALLGAWWLASARGWVPDQILPPPPMVFQVFTDLLVSGELASNLAISSVRLFWGFVAGAGVGLPLGLLMGLWAPAREYLFPTFRIVAQVPILAWLPMLMMLVGIDEALKVIIITKAVAVPIVMNTCKGLEGVPTLWIEVAKVYRFNRWQLLKKVVAPAAFPQIWAGVRYGLTHGWLALVVVELLASSEGLGFLIVYGRQLFQLDTVLAAVVLVGAVGWSLDRVLSLTESRLLKWRREAF